MVAEVYRGVSIYHAVGRDGYRCYAVEECGFLEGFSSIEKAKEFIDECSEE